MKTAELNGDSIQIMMLERLERIEAVLSLLAEAKKEKPYYTTSEVAKEMNKTDYTVREWARKGQIDAKKGPNGRGWLISYEEFQFIRSGVKPLPEKRS